MNKLKKIRDKMKTLPDGMDQILVSEMTGYRFTDTPDYEPTNEEWRKYRKLQEKEYRITEKAWKNERDKLVDMVYQDFLQEQKDEAEV